MTSAGSGFSATRLEHLESVMADMVQQGRTPGMVGVIHRRGQVAQRISAGWQDIENQVPMSQDTIFQIMSMTKPITATAVLRLVDDGRLGLYDPVDDHLPELANRQVLRHPGSALDDTVAADRPIRVIDLLSYRSGLASGGIPDFPAPDATPLETAVAQAYAEHLDDGERWLKALGSLPLANQPGSTWAYGTASDVLAVLVGRVAGMPFQEYLEREIFQPLGMTDTAFFVPTEKRARLAVLYRPTTQPGGIEASPVFSDVPDRPPGFPLGGYGLTSTVDDYLQFARMLLGHGAKDGVRILSRSAVALMTSNYLTDTQRTAIPWPSSVMFESIGWGLGLSVVVDAAKQHENFAFSSAGAFGWPGAFGTWWQADPSEDLIQIYLHQYFTGEAWDLPRLRFQQLGYDAIDD